MKHFSLSLETTQGSTAIDWIAEGTTLYPGAYCTYTPFIGGLITAKKR